MRPFSFTYGPRVLATDDGVAQLPGLLPDGPVLLVTDAHLISLGITMLITKLSTTFGTAFKLAVHSSSVFRRDRS